jgi:hypothetical protein
MNPTPGLPTNQLLWRGASARALYLRCSGCRNLALRAFMDKPRLFPIDLSPIRSSTNQQHPARHSLFRPNFGRKMGSTIYCVTTSLTTMAHRIDGMLTTSA